MRAANLIRGLLVGWLVVPVVSPAQDGPEPLPDPLSLQDALVFGEQPHPDLELAAARRDRALADLDAVAAESDPTLSFEGGLVAVDPAYNSVNPSNNDSYAILTLRKRLYDWGYTEASTTAAERRLSGRDLEYLDARQQRRLAVMRSYFDVLLADLAYARDNEAMAAAFVDVDKARDRNELGQVSDIRLMELDALYQETRMKRFESQARQRATRARLANALNRPGELPANLLMPPQPDFAAALPDFDELLAAAFAGNPGLAALRARVESAEQAVAAAEASHGPVLSGFVEGGAYNRPSLTRNPFTAGVVLELPILPGGARDAALAEARAALRAERARLAQAELDLRAVVTELWLEVQNLRVRLDALDVLGDYRELYLDRSRALYEMEVRTDLGDAMVETSVVRYRRAEAIFDWLMAEARLQALTGRLVGSGEDRVEEESTP
jgi:outer membrane protein TolC